MPDRSIAAPSAEPLSAWFSPVQTRAGVREQRFECASRGDRVSGRTWRPAASSALPLVLAVHDLARDKDDPSLEAAARDWASAGWATAAIDLPLHGERHNAKLSRRAISAATATSPDRQLWNGLVAQAVHDLARALDALLANGDIDSARIAGVAFGDAAPIAHALASFDLRVRAVAAIGAERAFEHAVPAEPQNGAPPKTLSWIPRPDDLASFLASALRA